MAAPAVRSEVLSLYKCLLRESQKFTSYNFKAYSLRKIKDSFKEGKSINEPEAVAKQLKYAKENLDIIKRQAVISSLYSTEKLIIEK